MELDRHSLFGRHVTWCTQLYSLTETPQHPPPPPTPLIWTRIRGCYWSAEIDDISLWTPGLHASIMIVYVPPWNHVEALQLLNFDFNPDPAFHSDADLRPVSHIKVEKLLLLKYLILFFSVEPTGRWQAGRTFRLLIIGRNLSRGGASNSTAQVQCMYNSVVAGRNSATRQQQPVQQCTVWYWAKRMESERGNSENVSALSAGAFTTTWLVMVT